MPPRLRKALFCQASLTAIQPIGFSSPPPRTKGVVLATRDEHIIEYGKAGFVRVLKL